MYKIRRWSVMHARKLEVLYDLFEPIFIKLHPLWNGLGYGRVEKPVRAVESLVKGLLFDCQMCGQCMLGSSGMSCPMNCPKSIRNGPCGGVRLDGCCEVNSAMKCVWVDAWSGSQPMRAKDNIRRVQKPVNFAYKGSSSWLRVAHNKANASGSEAA